MAPPDAAESVVSPASTLTSPPEPSEPRPTDTVIEPPDPDCDSPDDNDTDPDDPDAIAAARARAPYVLAAQDEPSGDSGCGGDDDELWRDDARSDASGYAPDQTTGSGCGPSEPSTASSSETDTLGDGADTASGCEGDDVSADETGDDGCGDSCEGDGLAEASSSARVRAHHAWVGRCVAWLPWALAFTAVRLMRRAARRGAR
jgi:hypothetical protein